VRSNTAKKKLWLCVSTAAVAAVAATGAFAVSSSGTITTLAGTDVWGFSGDGGPAISAKLYAPAEVAVDGRGNVYIATYQDSRVRRVSADGTISTFAGTGQPGFAGDGGPATSAKLYAPKGVAVDGQGNVYIADTNNFRVRKVSPGGTITTLAGGGKPGFLGDGGPATLATLRNPFGVAVDGQGNVYIADTDNMRVRKVSVGGTISTFAGGGRASPGDGGPATAAQLKGLWGVAVDGNGYVYFAEGGRVRKVAQAAALNLTLGGAPTQRLLAQKGITVTAGSDRVCSLVATGSVRILGTRYVFRLTRATASLAPGKRTITLPFPAAEQKRFRQLLRGGQKARAAITVRATDKAGTTTTSTRTVAVRS
jgi:hypothetical protein